MRREAVSKPVTLGCNSATEPSIPISHFAANISVESVIISNPIGEVASSVRHCCNPLPLPAWSHVKSLTLDCTPNAAFFGNLNLAADLDLTIIGLGKESVAHTLFQGVRWPLKRLELSKLQLSALPTGLFAGLSIQHELCLSGKYLQDVERAFNGSHLTELSIFRIDDAPVYQVCEALNVMPNLHILHLRRTLLSVIPRSLSTLTSLKSIDLSYNEIQNLELDVFAYHAQLTILDLGHNLIDNITLSTKNYTLPLLSTLSLRSNMLTVFSPQLLKVMPNLISLDIPSNSIASLPAPLPTSLSSLYAAGNQIKFLPKDLIAPSLQILDLSSNCLTKIGYIAVWALKAFL
jgi:Leucine-rich repeat (LRR) protein